MAASGLKRGEKILFGVFAILGVFAVVGFFVLEGIRHSTETPDKLMYPIHIHYDFSAEGLRGSTIFRKAECTQCHRAIQNGTNAGVDLDGIGSKRTLQYIRDFLKNPEATYPGGVTLDHGEAPKEAAFVAKMPLADIEAMAVFLSEMRADQGASTARLPVKGKSEFIDGMVKMWAPVTWKSEYKDIRVEATSNVTEGSNNAGSK